MSITAIPMHNLAKKNVTELNYGEPLETSKAMKM